MMNIAKLQRLPYNLTQYDDDIYIAQRLKEKITNEVETRVAATLFNVHRMIKETLHESIVPRKRLGR